MKIRDFGTPKERTIGGFVSLTGLYYVIKNSDIVKREGNIFFADSFESTRGGMNEPSRYDHPCIGIERELLEKVEIVIGRYPFEKHLIREYKIKEDSEFHHEHGVGGENVINVFLNRIYTLRNNIYQEERKPVLISAQLLTYDTLSDDSEDYNTGAIIRTELLDEEDELARAVFWDIRSLEEKW